MLCGVQGPCTTLGLLVCLCAYLHIPLAYTDTLLRPGNTALSNMREQMNHQNEHLLVASALSRVPLLKLNPVHLASHLGGAKARVLILLFCP